MATSENLSGFLNLPRLEQMFGQLMAQLAQQEGEIAALKERCARYDAVATRVSGLEAQVLRLETVSALPGRGLGRRAVETAPRSRGSDVGDRLSRDVEGGRESHDAHGDGLREARASRRASEGLRDHA